MAYQLFKGYVPTKNKECLMKFKNKTSDQLKSLREVSKLGEYAGILNDDTVMVDVDDYDLSEKLMDIVEEKQLACRVIETTKGKHFYFKNTNHELKNRGKSGYSLACGLEADVKFGHNTSYAVLKFGGKERPIIYDIYPDEEYQEVPKWLLPIKTNKEFWKLKKGDGRNQEMFNYILTLQSEGFSKEEARECLEIINKFVLDEPLDDKELNTILRDEAFQKPIFFEKNQFLFDKFANYMVSEHHIIKLNGQLHIYRDGIYSMYGIESQMIKHIPNLNRQKRSEVLDYIDILIDKNSDPAGAEYIAFKNGIYNIKNDTLEPFDPSKVILNRINHNYNPGAYFKPCDDVLNKLACKDENVRALLEEVIGFTFYRRNELRKGFILKGEKSNGKSTFLDMIKNLLGDENTCALDPKDFSDRFRPAELYGKLCDIGDDIEDDYIPNTAMLKKIISGDPITAERKGHDPFDFRSYAKILLSANNIPRMGKGKDSAAVIDRLIIVPFNAYFSPNDPDYNPNIKYELRTEECMEYLIQLGIKGLKRVLKANKFTTSESMKAELAEYEESNNPMLMFFKELEENEESLCNEPTKFGYQKYDEFCITNNLKKCSHIDFTKQVKSYYGYDVKSMRFNGKVCRVFIHKEEKEEAKE